MSIKQQAKDILAQMAADAGPDDCDGFELLTLIKLVNLLQEPSTNVDEQAEIEALAREFTSSLMSAPDNYSPAGAIEEAFDAAEQYIKYRNEWREKRRAGE